MKKNKLSPKIRIPTPRPTKFHSSRKGAKGYERAKAKEELIYLRKICSSENLKEE